MSRSRNLDRMTRYQPTSDDRLCPLYSGFPKWRQATWRRRTGTDAGLETEVLRLAAHPGWKFARLTAGGRWIRTCSTAARKPGFLEQALVVAAPDVSSIRYRWFADSGASPRF